MSLSVFHQSSCCLSPFHLVLCRYFKATSLVGILPSQGLTYKITPGFELIHSFTNSPAEGMWHCKISAQPWTFKFYYVNMFRLYLLAIRAKLCKIATCILRACLHERGWTQVGEVTRLSINSLILIDHLYMIGGVTRHMFPHLSPCKQALH